MGLLSPNESCFFIIILLVASSDIDCSSVSNGECRISVPALNMCFTTNKLQPLNLQGNIFDISKSTRPLTIQDYINILLDNDKHMDSELANMINNIQSLTARYRRLNDVEKPQGDISGRIRKLFSYSFNERFCISCSKS